MWFLVKAEAQAVAPHTFNLGYDRVVAIGVSLSLLLFVGAADCEADPEALWPQTN
jgi:hypothetical protein